MANGAQGAVQKTGPEKELIRKFTALAKAKTDEEKQMGFIELLGIIKKMKADPNSVVKPGEI